MRQPVSLRRRMTLYGLLTLVLALGMVGLALESAFRNAAETDLRQRMQTWAYLVLGETEVDASGTLQINLELGDPLLLQPGSGVYAHLQGSRDQWDSPSVLGETLPELAPAEPGEQRFLRLANGGYAWQLGLAWELADEQLEPFTLSVQVGPELLAEAIADFRTGLWSSLAFAALVLALAQALFFMLVLRPMRQVASDVARIESGASERLAGRYPLELEPLTTNLDRLLATEKANQTRYRNALDSLAHSLKTPLAVIQASLREGQTPEVPVLRKAADEMHFLISTRLQRAAASTRRTLAAPVAVQTLVERLLASLARVYSRDLRNFELSMQPGLSFYGEERDLLELMGNLLDNACKYGGGRVRVSGRQLTGEGARPGLSLRVENDGVAPAAGRLESLAQRGRRGDEQVAGHGLGLSLVAELVSAYGGTLAFGHSDLGGAAVIIELPGS